MSNSNNLGGLHGGVAGGGGHLLDGVLASRQVAGGQISGAVGCTMEHLLGIVVINLEAHIGDASVGTLGHSLNADASQLVVGKPAIQHTAGHNLDSLALGANTVLVRSNNLLHNVETGCQRANFNSTVGPCGKVANKVAVQLGHTVLSASDSHTSGGVHGLNIQVILLHMREPHIYSLITIHHNGSLVRGGQ